jgi:PAS domain-containing protein
VILPNVFDVALHAAVAFVAAGLALALLAALDLRGRVNRRSILAQTDDRTVFLFDDDSLVDATPDARRLLGAAPGDSTEWTRLMSLLSPRFPGLEAALEGLPEEGILHRAAEKGGLRLCAELRGTLVRLTLSDPDAPDAPVTIDAQSLDAIERELQSLRAIAEQTPFLIWRQTPDGRITWVNRAYLDTVERLHGPDVAGIWPPPALFETSRLGPGQKRPSRRVSLTRPGMARIDWYECHAAPLGEDMLFTAVDANATVLAEDQLREFMQTLTKTFAHLTIGLAVFDRARRLALFNPALTDLTGLPVDFLTGRPTLFGFLDKLRERHMIPEPKDYKGWRRRLVELEAAAADGSYAEMWSLPHGLTYRVTGRPHPDGAVAFLFEDISAEISLTRRFRSELEIGQGALDAIDDAIAVFSGGGILILANTAYAELWGVDPDTSLSDIDVLQATRRWMERSAPTPVWGDLRDFITRTHDRSDWSADIRLKDGRGFTCRVAPISSGATMVRFQRGAEVETPRRAIAAARPA